MPVLLVTYDLSNEKKARDGYAGLLKEIKEYPWARLSESSYAIETWETPQQVFEKLKQHTDPNDYMLILTLNAPWYGLNRQDVADWLRAKL